MMAKTKKTGNPGTNGKKGTTSNDFVPISDNDQPSSVIYIGHLPHGFYENEMSGFFAQFGKVSKVRVSRSKRSGRSKGFAFVKFESGHVASTVAEVMNGYHLFDKVLVSHVVPQHKIHKTMFKGANKVLKPVPWHMIAKRQHNKAKTAEDLSRMSTRQLNRARKKQEKLKSLGIDYDFAEILHQGTNADRETKVERKTRGTKRKAAAKKKSETTVEKIEEETNDEEVKSAPRSTKKAKGAKSATKAVATKKRKTPVKRATRRSTRSRR